MYAFLEARSVAILLILLDNSLFKVSLMIFIATDTVTRPALLPNSIK